MTSSVDIFSAVKSKRKDHTLEKQAVIKTKEREKLQTALERETERKRERERERERDI
jgi:hypothetical protein